jgi:UDP-glucose 4-epimerase
MSRILVTGSEGFIGSFLLPKLLVSGHEIYTIDLKPSRVSLNHFQTDITDTDLDSIFSSVKPEVVVHLAAQVVVLDSFENPHRDLEVNGFGTLSLVRASLKAGCSNFCYIHSGGAVYDSDSPIPFDERGHENPVSPYGLSKNLGEGYVRILSELAGSSWSSLAYSNIYGPVLEHKRGVIYEFWNALTNGLSPTIFGGNVTRDFLFIDDAVRAILIAIDNPTNSRVNISAGVEISIAELFLMISRQMKVSIEPIVKAPRPGEILRSCLDNNRAKEILKWIPKVSLEDGLALCIPSNEKPLV